MPSAASRSNDGSPDTVPPSPTTALVPTSTTLAPTPAAAASSASSATQAASTSSSSSMARQSPKARPRPLNHQHHPYRIELLDLTPVSVSLLWSTRPPPLSAIPLEVVNSQLRKRLRSRPAHSSTHRSTSPHSTSARATAVSPSPPSASSAAASKSRSTPAAHNAPDPNPITKLTEGLVATRSLNRKVTKIRLRAPPTVPAQPRRSSNSSVPSDSAHNSANDDETWPSDDGATAVEDEAGSASDASDSGYEGGIDARHHITSVFKDRVSVTVNGQDWSHVLLGERGSHEAIVVIFGLEPESDYDIQFLVKAGLDGAHDAFRASFRTRAERDSSRSLESSAAPLQSATSTATSAVRPASPSPLGRLPLSAPELDPIEPAPQRLAVLQAELEASETLKASLIADVKKARKESSKQEASLRHEIDAVKRGMDRMSATDHRSRQKVLALQELIKQTTIHTKEIHEEAEQTEKEQPEWEEQDAELNIQVEALRSEVEAEEAAAQAEWDKDEAALAALEKELKSLEAAAKALEAERDELRDDKLASVHSEIQKVKDQAKEELNRPPGHARRGGAAAGFPARGGHRHASGPSHMTAYAPGAKGKSHQGARGGKAGSFGNRAASGPAGQFGAKNSNTGSHGFAGGFMQNFGKGFRRGPAHNANQTQSFDAMGGAGFSGTAGPNVGAMLPPGPGYGPGGMQDASMVGGGFGAGQPYGTLDPYYAQSHQQTARFPSGASEASQDDLYDPTLGFDPYDPSIDARRRSSLPLPQLSYAPQASKLPTSTTTSALNPANPEFVPSTGSNHASPVISKNTSASSTRTAPAPLATSTALPPHTAAAQSPPPGVASVEHSPTTSSRFAFPLARHLPTAGGASSSLTHKSSSSALASANAAGGSELNVLPPAGMGSNLFSMAPPGTASPFARHSPLLPQTMDGSAGSAAASLAFAGASPRFGTVGLAGSTEEGAGSALASAPFGASSKFGPLDYDPSLDGFGPAPGLGSGLSAGANANLPPFSSTTMSSIFGASDTWSAPGLPGSSALAASTAPGSTGWLTSSPPLGSSASAGGDIWSAPGLPGVPGVPGVPGMPQLRSKMSLNELGGSQSGSPIGAPAVPFGGNRVLGPIGQAAIASVPSRSSPLASPVAASPTTRDAAQAVQTAQKEEPHETAPHDADKSE